MPCQFLLALRVERQQAEECLGLGLADRQPGGGGLLHSGSVIDGAVVHLQQVGAGSGRARSTRTRRRSTQRRS